MNPEFRHSLLIASEQMCIEKRGDRGREPSDKCIMATSQDIPTLLHQLPLSAMCYFRLSDTAKSIVTRNNASIQTGAKCPLIF